MASSLDAGPEPINATALSPVMRGRVGSVVKRRHQCHPANSPAPLLISARILVMLRFLKSSARRTSSCGTNSEYFTLRSVSPGRLVLGLVSKTSSIFRNVVDCTSFIISSRKNSDLARSICEYLTRKSACLVHSEKLPASSSRLKTGNCSSNSLNASSAVLSGVPSGE